MASSAARTGLGALRAWNDNGSGDSQQLLPPAAPRPNQPPGRRARRRANRQGHAVRAAHPPPEPTARAARSRGDLGGAAALAVRSSLRCRPVSWEGILDFRAVA